MSALMVLSSLPIILSFLNNVIDYSLKQIITEANFKLIIIEWAYEFSTLNIECNTLNIEFSSLNIEFSTLNIVLIECNYEFSRLNIVLIECNYEFPRLFQTGAECAHVFPTLNIKLSSLNIEFSSLNIETSSLNIAFPYQTSHSPSSRTSFLAVTTPVLQDTHSMKSRFLRWWASC